MSTEKPGWMRRWLRRVVRFAALVVLLVLAAVPVLIWSGAADAYLRRATIHRLEAMTGGKVEAREFSMHWWGLRATVKGLVIHGREPAGTEPLLSLDELQLDLKVESMWGRRISVENAVLRAPHVHIRVEKNGLSNVPSPVRPRTAQKSPVQELFALHIGAIQVTDGWILYNDVGLPLAIEGGDLTIGLNASGGPDNTIYSGAVQWQNLNLTAQRYFPVPASVSLRFTLARDRFSVEQVLACFAGSQLDAQAEMSDFADPHWKFRYRGWLRLEDVRHVLRKPMTPEGRVDFRGEGTFAGGQVHVRGDYSAGEIAMRYPLFSASGMSSRGSYILDNRGVEVPDFRAQALQGTVTGRVSLLFKGAAFRAETHTRGASLGEALDALNQPAFPVAALGWDGVVSADTVQTWAADFKQFDIGGEAHWTQPETPAAGRLPTAGDFRFRYLHELRTLQASSGEITTPSSRITFSGRLAANNSALDTHFETGDLHAWNTFYHAIERFASSGKAHAMDIAGSARWDGDITGPLQGPTFAGHARGERVRYGPLDADLVEGDLSYSPARLAFTHGRVRRGATSAEVEASLELSGWSFRPQNEWTADANLTQSSVEDLQILLHSSYPLSGTLTGQFHGRGTRAEPGVTGLFDLADGHAGGLAFNRLRGQLNWGSEEIRVSNAELRVQARGGAAQSAGVITGAAGYRFSDGRVSLDLVGAGFPLERFNEIQSARLPIGGSLSFRVQAQGPLTAPQGEGSFRVVDLRAARQVIGSFEGKLSSDGNEVQLQLGSAMNTGKVTGMFRAGLHGDLPLSGKLTLSGMDLDPFV
ncbi:MAG TPA: hypothetical protein VEH49_04115, partial [Methylomirabilota bacterium]|nr:hypothetical protein [Methylomirabilota bacterium]